jgi:hypothetical protein
VVVFVPMQRVGPPQAVQGPLTAGGFLTSIGTDPNQDPRQYARVLVSCASFDAAVAVSPESMASMKRPVTPQSTITWQGNDSLDILG